MSVLCVYVVNIKDKFRFGSILSVCNNYCFFCVLKLNVLWWILFIKVGCGGKILFCL